jgi:hypothetical protein
MKRLLPNSSFALAIFVQLTLWFVVKDDPFFGDSISSTSQAASHIYAQQLSTIFYPLSADPGHPTLYAYGLATCWIVFGKTLWVAHAYSCVWALALIFAFRKVASCILSPAETHIATILVMLFPTYLAQSAMMLNTVAVMTFFLLAVYGVLQQKSWVIMLAASFMCITHLQSAFLLLSLSCFDLLQSITNRTTFSLGKWVTQRLWVYAIPFGVFVCWLFLHKQHTGWLLVSPQYNDANELNGMKEYIRAVALMCWRLVDYGMLPFYLILVWVVWQQRQSRITLLHLLSLIVPCCLSMAIFLNHTIGHRYFMAFGMLVIIYSVYLTRYLQVMGRVLIYGSLAISLIAGNFLHYPGKTLGDATLAYRSFFPLLERARATVSSQIYSHAPIANDDSLTYLRATNHAPIIRLNDAMLDTLPFVVQSNVNAEFTDEDKRLLATWYGNSLEEGAVYVNVFANPKFVKAPIGWKLRQPSKVEQWMTDWKKRLDR